MNLKPKKLFVVDLLHILAENSDSEHTLSITEIYNLINKTEGYDISYATVRRTLTDLITFNYPVCCLETQRQTKNGKLDVRTGWYYDHNFDQSELRMIIDSLLFLKFINGKARDEILRKIESLSSRYFKSRTAHISKMDLRNISTNELYYVLDVLDEAISRKKKVSFKYCTYGTDRKMHPRLNSSGEERIYIINPYYIVPGSQRYYLICNYNSKDSCSFYRVDRIKEIRILSDPVKPPSQLKDFVEPENLPKHLAEHIYMFTGNSSTIELKVSRFVISDIIDWFGTDVTFTDYDENFVLVKVKSNEKAMSKWALQYGEFVEILKPDSVRQEVARIVKLMSERYCSCIDTETP